MTYTTIIDAKLQEVARTAFEKLSPGILENYLNTLSLQDMKSLNMRLWNPGAPGENMSRREYMTEGLRWYYGPFLPLTREGRQEWTEDEVDASKNLISERDLVFLNQMVAWGLTLSSTRRPRFFSRDVVNLRV
jgi:hypothetical protein|uniref:Uncharacterized protein n=1 Tax=viral metagenome TaxID=1070528 RepID=A0A6C0DZ39_9ZZZZ